MIAVMHWLLQLPRIEHFPRDRSNTKAYLHQKRHMKPYEMDMHAIALGNLKPAVLALGIFHYLLVLLQHFLFLAGSHQDIRNSKLTIYP